VKLGDEAMSLADAVVRRERLARTAGYRVPGFGRNSVPPPR